jgi:hypothetical protein
MKKDKYINGDERGGFKVDKVNLPLSDGRFLEGEEDRLEEGLLVPVKKNKREGLLLTDKTRIHLRSASVRTYTFFTTGFPRFLSIRGARGLLALKQVLI